MLFFQRIKESDIIAEEGCVYNNIDNITNMAISIFKDIPLNKDSVRYPLIFLLK